MNVPQRIRAVRRLEECEASPPTLERSDQRGVGASFRSKNLGVSSRTFSDVSLAPEWSIRSSVESTTGAGSPKCHSGVDSVGWIQLATETSWLDSVGWIQLASKPPGWIQLGGFSEFRR